MTDAQPRLGVDFGRVISGGSPPGVDDSDFFDGPLDAALRTPAVPGMWEVLPSLVDRFDGRVWVVSKCGEWIEERTLSWLEHHRFAERTGIPRTHVRFCRERADKAVHAAELGLTHFVDDRLDVLEHMRGLVPRLYLFGPQEVDVPDWVRHTPTWQAVWDSVNADDRD